MQNMGRGYSYPVLRAKMLFGTKTAKAPMYQRISKETGSLPEGIQAAKYISNPNYIFSLNPCDGGGVVESLKYYSTVKEDGQLEAKQELWDAQGYLMPFTPEQEMAILRNEGLKLVENGGASIEKIIAYYEEHGECI